MKKALLKNTLREIRNTKARFISILMIIALGVGFFVGVKSASPSMEKMARDYYSDTNLMDFRIVSTVGFDEDDVKAVKSCEKIKDVMPSYFSDVTVSLDDTSKTIRLMSAPSEYEENNAISTIELVEGRMPLKKNEIVVESASLYDYNIGDTITIDEKVYDTDVSEQLKGLEYTIVGTVKSPMYISFERGTTTIGDGKIDEYAYVHEDAFDIERYTVIYATIDIGKEVSPFSDDYEKIRDDIARKLEETADERVEVFIDENIDKAQKEIDKNRKELIKKKADTKKELADAKAKIDEGESEYYSQISSAQAQIDSAEYTVSKSKSELYSKSKELNDNKDKFNTEISKAKKELENATSEYEKGCAKIEEAKQTKASLEAQVCDTATGTINTVVYSLPEGVSETVITTLSGYALSVTYDNAVGVLSEAKAFCNTAFSTAFDGAFDAAINGINTINENIALIDTEIKSGEEELLTAKTQLDDAKKELEEKESSTLKEFDKYDKEILDAQKQIASADSKLNDSKAQLNDAKESGLSKINEGKAEYEKAEKDAQKGFREAEEKIDDAQKELDSVETPKWYVFTRDDNPGYSGFSSNTNRVDAVATVFPLFFLLVAMLVCLTTMTRLVEEKRTEIGTLKALGYNNSSIISKFIIYACLAAFFGCILGFATCVPILPRVIWNAYGMLYDMRDIEIVVHKFSLFSALVAAFACCALVTLGVCYKSLRHKPATLMRPKTPKAGKRILLERITVLWNHFNFSSKVTWRNLFRYKSRLFMTAIGIAGCTALMFTAFGLYDSINDIVTLQFESLSKYNTIIVTDEDKDEKDLSVLLKALDGDSRISDTAAVMQKNVSIKSDSKKVDSDVYISVAHDSKDFQKLITLRNRTTKDKITLCDDGVVLTEKLAKRLNVSVGDEVMVAEYDKPIKVTGIAENYVYNYIYMSSEVYEKLSGEKPKFNTVYAKSPYINEDVEKEIGTDYLKRDEVVAVSFTSTIQKEFDDMIGSMNMIVLVMIISAGALAIVVLYNLTNINLAERNREIATIKVLGFYHSETSAFVYRENIILTIIGIVFGLGLGIWLLQFVVNTVEIDNIMFGRDIHISSFVLSSVMTFVFSLIVNFIMYFRIKAINMVESLKSIE